MTGLRCLNRVLPGPWALALRRGLAGLLGERLGGAGSEGPPQVQVASWDTAGHE